MPNWSEQLLKELEDEDLNGDDQTPYDSVTKEPAPGGPLLAANDITRDPASSLARPNLMNPNVVNGVPTPGLDMNRRPGVLPSNSQQAGLVSRYIKDRLMGQKGTTGEFIPPEQAQAEGKYPNSSLASMLGGKGTGEMNPPPQSASDNDPRFLTKEAALQKYMSGLGSGAPQGTGQMKNPPDQSQVDISRKMPPSPAAPKTGAGQFSPPQEAIADTASNPVAQAIAKKLGITNPQAVDAMSGALKNAPSGPARPDDITASVHYMDPMEITGNGPSPGPSASPSPVGAPSPMPSMSPKGMPSPVPSSMPSPSPSPSASPQGGDDMSMPHVDWKAAEQALMKPQAPPELPPQAAMGAGPGAQPLPAGPPPNLPPALAAPALAAASPGNGGAQPPIGMPGGLGLDQLESYRRQLQQNNTLANFGHAASTLARGTLTPLNPQPFFDNMTAQNRSLEQSRENDAYLRSRIVSQILQNQGASKINQDRLAAMYGNQGSGPAPGAATGGGPGAEPPDPKRVYAMSQALAKQLNPNQGTNNNMAKNQARKDQADRVLALMDQTGGNPDSRQMHELAISVQSLLAPGGNSSESMTKALLPSTAQGSWQKAMEWFSNQPRGTEQQAFAARLRDTVERERAQAASQLQQAQRNILPAHAEFKKYAPEAYRAVIAPYGLDQDQQAPANAPNQQRQQAPAKPAGAVPKVVRHKATGQLYYTNPDGSINSQVPSPGMR